VSVADDDLANMFRRYDNLLDTAARTMVRLQNLKASDKTKHTSGIKLQELRAQQEQLQACKGPDHVWLRKSCNA
jgi:hypothetical protein